jgi:signal transduction histidine kinase
LITEAISPDDFTQRINFSGKLDEVGRLEITINHMLDRLQTAFKYERRFTANVSHELRTPLTIMKGKIEVTLNRDRSIIEYHKIFKDLEQEVYRLIRLVNGLLFLVRLEQEEVEHYWQFSLINISDLLEILIEQFKELNLDKNIQISAKIQPNLWIDGNADYLTNLFLNLLDNAVKYTPSGEQIAIAIYQQENQFISTIKNTGNGISVEHLPYLFERFYRVKDYSSQEITGTGLGLAIVQEIAYLHKGIITVDSQTEGEVWTSFKLSLPIHQQI